LTNEEKTKLEMERIKLIKERNLKINIEIEVKTLKVNKLNSNN